VIVDPFRGLGRRWQQTVEGWRFVGCDVDAGCFETTRRRLTELAGQHELVSALSRPKLTTQGFEVEERRNPVRVDWHRL